MRDGELARRRPSRRAIARGPDGGAEARGIARAVLVGHSYGGAVVAAFAAAHPERVAGAVYGGSTLDPSAFPETEGREILTALRDPARRGAVLEAWFGGILKNARPGVADRVMAALRRTDPRAFDRTAEPAFFWDPKPALRRYRGPRLAIVAAGEYAESAATYHALASFPHVVVPGVSRWLVLDEPAVFARHLDGFLGRVAPAARAR